MNKKLLMSAIAMVVIFSASGISYANDGAEVQEKQHIKMERPIYKFDGPRHHKFKGQPPSKAEMEAKKAEFEKRLNLTEKQKEQIEKNKQQDREKMKTIFEKMKENKDAIKEIHQNDSLSPEDKVTKSAEYEKNLIDLKVKANELRKENMKNFENILTEEQKVEFAKIKEEQKKEMEKRRGQFKGKRGFKGSQPPIGLPVQPKPIPVER